jgi:hypothetical protein
MSYVKILIIKVETACLFYYINYFYSVLKDPNSKFKSVLYLRRF